MWAITSTRRPANLCPSHTGVWLSHNSEIGKSHPIILLIVRQKDVLVCDHVPKLVPIMKSRKSISWLAIIIGHSYAICTNGRPTYWTCVRYLGHIGRNSHGRIACGERVVCYDLCEYIRITSIHKLTQKSHLNPFPLPLEITHGLTTWNITQRREQDLTNFKRDLNTNSNENVQSYIYML